MTEIKVNSMNNKKKFLRMWNFEPNWRCRNIANCITYQYHSSFKLILPFPDLPIHLQRISAVASREPSRRHVALPCAVRCLPPAETLGRAVTGHTPWNSLEIQKIVNYPRNSKNSLEIQKIV
jgi:hypothetical protein